MPDQALHESDLIADLLYMPLQIGLRSLGLNPVHTQLLQIRLILRDPDHFQRRALQINSILPVDLIYFSVTAASNFTYNFPVRPQLNIRHSSSPHIAMLYQIPGRPESTFRPIILFFPAPFRHMRILFFHR